MQIKKSIWCLFVFLILGNAFCETESGSLIYEDFNVDMAYKLIQDENALLLDVRPLWDYLDLHLDGARRIECSELTSKIVDVEKLVKGNKATPIVVYAQSRERAAIAKNILIKNGFPNTLNLGIMHDWFEKVR